MVPAGLLERLLPIVQDIGSLISEFRRSDPTPQSTCEFEQRLHGLLREVGRILVEWVFNHVEPDKLEEMPQNVLFDGEYFRRRRKTPNRHVGTLFGKITLYRFVYQPMEAAGRCIFPLQIQLGIEARLATPALADRVGQYVASHPQSAVLALLRRDWGVAWSAKSLRKVVKCLSDGMAEYRHQAQVAKLLELLHDAYASKGSRKPILAVGRDGIFLPIRKQTCWREAAVATVSVHDRRGKRLGTVYLGHMPEANQSTITRQLTSLLQEVLRRWTGPLPRLVYITDGGHHPTEYYEQVLRRMNNPKAPSEYLVWERMIDYYHACRYITKLSEALFAATEKGASWAAKMRRWLKNKPAGIYRVLHSAAAIRHCHGLRGRLKDYNNAYTYLQRRIPLMNYAEQRRQHLPIGSGITEAGCKTVFTQRLKQSGMTWSIAGGQPIVNLRILVLSNIWSTVYTTYLASKQMPKLPTQSHLHKEPIKIPA